MRLRGGLCLTHHGRDAFAGMALQLQELLQHGFNIVHVQSTGTKLSKEQLFEKAEKFIENSGFFGPFTEESKDMLDKDFVFRGPGAPQSTFLHSDIANMPE